MKKIISLIVLSSFLIFSNALIAQKKSFYENVQKKNVAKVLDDLNIYASNADFKNYFGLFAPESQYIGTDATEVWTKQEFSEWAKPFFDKKTTWNFKSLKRNIFFSKDGNYAWFDEILDTQMKICRGSGVLEKIGGKWKIKQYVLSVTVPNEVIDEVTKLKAPIEDALIQKLK